MGFNASSYPGDQDLVDFLSCAGLWDSSMTDCVSGFAAAAAEQWEMETGYIPFLSSGASGTYYYDPPGSVSKAYQYPWRGGGKILEFDGSFISISAIDTGINFDNPTGSSVDLNRFIYFIPNNYSNRHLPIEGIEFTYQIWGSPRSIRVKGVPGYTLTLPHRVWLAILNKAAAMFIPVVQGFITNGVLEMREADVAERYGADMFQSFVDGFNRVWSASLTQYTKMRWGV